MSWGIHNIPPHDRSPRYLYIALAERADMVKVGLSRNPHKRVRGLYCVFKERPRLVDFFQVGLEIESRFHQLLRSRAAHGWEWYPNQPFIFDAYEAVKQGGIAALRERLA